MPFGCPPWRARPSTRQVNSVPSPSFVQEAETGSHQLHEGCQLAARALLNIRWSPFKIRTETWLSQGRTCSLIVPAISDIEIRFHAVLLLPPGCWAYRERFYSKVITSHNRWNSKSMADRWRVSRNVFDPIGNKTIVPGDIKQNLIIPWDVSPWCNDMNSCVHVLFGTKRGWENPN